MSTAPDAASTHWSQVFLPIEQAAEVSAGESVSVRIDRPQYGEWTWRTQVGSSSFKQSTFLGMPMTPQKLLLASESAAASQNIAGQIQSFVLQAMDGETSSEAIATALIKKFPDRFPDQAVALRYVIAQVRVYGR